VAYLKPPAVVRRVFNPLVDRFGFAGAETVVVRGRRTGQPRKAPVRPLSYDGNRYLVSTYGEADWVRNLRAADGKGELRRGRTSRPFSAVEVPVHERQPIIDAYCKTSSGFVKSYFEKLPDPADHPVFRIVGACGGPMIGGR
jgi:deazaflavin-dependent oxidoreductase (nitroreductase family)